MSEEDRDLMRLAAKAIGVQIEFLSHANGLESVVAEHEDPSKHITDGYMWNPLEDDGDALRLAVKLEMEMYTGSLPDGDAEQYVSSIPGEYMCERHRGDAMRATRRAIVRAAAEIGKATA